jgi:hypothetical protein
VPSQAEEGVAAAPSQESIEDEENKSTLIIEKEASDQADPAVNEGGVNEHSQTS